MPFSTSPFLANAPRPRLGAPTASESFLPHPVAALRSLLRSGHRLACGLVDRLGGLAALRAEPVAVPVRVESRRLPGRNGRR